MAASGDNEAKRARSGSSSEDDSSTGGTRGSVKMVVGAGEDAMDGMATGDARDSTEVMSTGSGGRGAGEGKDVRAASAASKVDSGVATAVPSPFSASAPTAVAGGAGGKVAQTPLPPLARSLRTLMSSLSVICEPSGREESGSREGEGVSAGEG